MLPSYCVPGVKVIIALSEGYRAFAKPKRKTHYAEPVDWWNQETVDDKEVHDEMNDEE